MTSEEPLRRHDVTRLVSGVLGTLLVSVGALGARPGVLDPTLTGPEPLKGERHHGLSPRELEVLQLICQGHGNRAIAERLRLSVNTVGVHRANIMSRLGVHKTAELVVYALRHGLAGPL